MIYRQTGMKMHRWVAALGLLFAACGASTDDAFDVIRQGQSTGAYELGSSKLVDYLDGSGEGQPLVVEGTITGVEEGVGMAWTLDEQGENEQRTILPFGDASSMVESAHLVVDVVNVLAAPEDTSFADGQVRFGISVDDAGEVAALRDGLVDQSVVVFLRRNAVFDYEEDLFGVVLDGALLCRRGEAQPLECPALESGLASALELASVTDEMPDDSGVLILVGVFGRSEAGTDLAGRCTGSVGTFADDDAPELGYADGVELLKEWSRVRGTPAARPIQDAEQRWREERQN